jgi:hypothetical protein
VCSMYSPTDDDCLTGCQQDVFGLGLLLNWRSGGPVHGVFLQSGLNFWSPLRGSGPSEPLDGAIKPFSS